MGREEGLGGWGGGRDGECLRRGHCEGKNEAFLPAPHSRTVQGMYVTPLSPALASHHR